jgi:hypothetical protein
MTQLLSPLTSTPYPTTSSNAITDLLEVPDAVLWIEKYVTMRFATTAARDAAIPVPEDGMMAYIVANPRQLFIYNGLSTAWELVWQGGGWLTWTVVSASGLTLGNGTITGRYQIDKKTCRAQFALTFGSTTAFSAAPLLLNPVAISTTGYVGQQNCGVATLFDTSAGTAGKLMGGIFVNSTASSGVGSFGIASSGGQINATIPFTWATGDILSGNLEFETT